MKLLLPQLHVDTNISRRDLTSLAEHHSGGNLKANTKALASLQHSCNLSTAFSYTSRRKHVIAQTCHNSPSFTSKPATPKNSTELRSFNDRSTTDFQSESEKTATLCRSLRK
nr:hypothetical protein Iba_scaffold686CG0550 [Ipomoea batatas]GME15251.1 hypothetical protein Iba_scaffold16029CG0050 [Ipomoea batatas]